jgi:hypothetical protein
MSIIHYKFQSNRNYASITFDGPAITLRDLKEQISEAKSFPKSSDMELVISNAQTGEGIICFWKLCRVCNNGLIPG